MNRRYTLKAANINAYLDEGSHYLLMRLNGRGNSGLSDSRSDGQVYWISTEFTG